uniref:Titin n=1 Tax=Paramormyrops kingsleyae TaxID=1676925 RepID=A0A3B3Q8E3_9TELE
MEVEQGTDIKIVAKIKGCPFPTLTWQKAPPYRKDEKTDVEYDEHINKLVTDNTCALLIKQGKRADTGIYTITASNSLGKASKEIRLNVLEPPELLLDANMAREHLAMVGTDIILSAGIKGVPFPKVTWKKNNEEVPPRANVEVTGVGSKLQIHNCLRSDCGDYTISVENSAETISLNVFIFFHLVAPTIEVDVKLIEGIVVKAGSTIKLPAIMKGIPVPNPKWVTDGKEIKSEGNVLIKTDHYSTTVTIKDCKRQDTGEYLLTVSNPAGSKTVALHVTVIDVPGAPTGPVNMLEVTPDFMVINWRPPKDDGGTPLMNYIVEKKDTKKPWEPWAVVSSGSINTKAKVSYLEKGLAQDITETAVTIQWEAPLSDGGSPIIGYIIERREMTGKWIRLNKTPVLDTRYRASGLFEGNTYEFRVFAENIAGISEPSPVSDPVKTTRPITCPGPPVNVKLKDWSKSYADLVWTKPSRDGGSPILGYIVECQKSSSKQWDRINKDELIKPCAYRVPGLIEGMEYKIRVRACNKIGEGEPKELNCFDDGLPAYIETIAYFVICTMVGIIIIILYLITLNFLFL